jgi:hypothetical protein
MVLRCKTMAALALLAGCAPVLRTPPPGLVPHREVTVFCDGFHSGLLLPAEPDTAFLDPRHDDALAASPRIEVGFGADGWRGGGETSSMTTMSLVLHGGPGLLLLARRSATRPARPEGPPVRTWDLTLDEAGWKALVAAIAARRVALPEIVRAPGQVEYIALSDRHWSVTANCHDFTREMLAETGLVLREPWFWSSADDLIDLLDAARSELAGRGIAVLGPELAPAEPER